ncbi:hypothetical protein PENSPDRAFT_646792 [Peniophora sp. CONT]|nr:hypothetical protein PENSPDRAFT_646792 [Peniophora sp. CONT]
MQTRTIFRTQSCLRLRHCRFSSTIPDFAFYPDFLDVKEQTTLLDACMKKLDLGESRRMRRRREQYLAVQREDSSAFPEVSQRLANHFLPDDLYHFEEGHFDGVIRHYREMHVSTWNPVESPELESVLRKLETLYPPAKYGTQTHILHLASEGDILPHVDNVEASGTWIMGVSLGATRRLCLDPVEQGGQAADRTYETILPSGSVYIQSGATRYRYAHSILRGSGSTPGQRLSLMVRDRLASSEGESGMKSPT